MREADKGETGIVASLLARPDELMLELGAGGELLVARVRALLCAIVLLLPLLAAAGGASTTEVLIGLGAAIFINLMAQVWLALARPLRRHRWLPHVTSIYDVTVTSCVLALLGWYDPVAGMNSTVVWCFYVIAIVLTALRNDGRLTLYIGALAMLQYLALVAAIFLLVPPRQLVSIDYGSASIGGQAERLVLLLIVTLVTATIVYRMQRLVELSGRDGLTGLPNRAWLLQSMPRTFEEARASGASLTLAMLDLDGFRRINDEAGHRGGDRAIRQVAAELSGMLEENEHIARIGGQEFVLLLRCPVGSAWERLDRRRRLLCERPFQAGRGGAPQRLTFSAGLAAWPQDGADVSALLGAADRRLQQAKREGRNRVVARDA
ncbi:GGDEF domain-containing protein [Luteimonas sp. RD2P54]|uniref:diguanylate cyclase n=1 Tax=Luteimonas endophytica TaxID=3042023 RepID=A0ABT6J9T8_9GAMM|nr:GGDEF domain-containing protein [Luteimonas endophytica]MDH5822958.1 GGDEF domain-containing protein [Luteimonas endophytica]